MKGTITVEFIGVPTATAIPNIQFTNGNLTCSGSSGEAYTTPDIPITCSDGRKGLISGDALTLNDGTRGKVFWDDAASAF